MSNLIVISIAGFPAKKLQIAANLVETRTQQDLGSGLFDSVRTKPKRQANCSYLLVNLCNRVPGVRPRRELVFVAYR